MNTFIAVCLNNILIKYLKRESFQKYSDLFHSVQISEDPIAGDRGRKEVIWDRLFRIMS